MAPGTAASLHEAAAELLATAEAVLATTVGGPVARAYLSPGLPALDYMCDQIAVWTGAIGDETAGALSPTPVIGQRRRLAWIPLASITTMTARCIKTGKSTSKGYTPPTIAELTADAEKTMEDGWALYNGYSTAIIQDGLLGGTCQDIKFTPMTPLDPQGGMAGWLLTLIVELNGYR